MIAVLEEELRQSVTARVYLAAALRQTQAVLQATQTARSAGPAAAPSGGTDDSE